jgi:Alr-MurF fusion protein
MFTITQIQKITNAKLVAVNNSNATIANLCIDSRFLSFAAESLFFAIEGTRDGHNFIQDAYQNGIRNFIVSKKVDCITLPKSNVLLVKNVLKALQQIAYAHRSQFDIATIGITGSNGKTIVKEWLNQLLQNDYNIVRSPKSYNSQIGVPLSVWNINASHNLAIFEAGISQPNEMKYLQKIIQPQIGIFTNIGTAHNEGFADNVKQKVLEKLNLFVNSTVVIYNTDQPLVASLIHLKLKNKTLIGWGKTNTASIRVISTVIKNNSTKVTVEYLQNKLIFILPFSDSASIENGMHCISLLLYKNFSEKSINQKLKNLQPVALRLEQKKGNNNCLLINDSYSNDLDSLAIALHTLHQWSGKRKQVLLLSDLEQSSIHETTLYKKVATLIQQHPIDQIIAIGNQIAKHKKLFTFCKKTVFLSNTEEAKEYIKRIQFVDKAILFKGARSFALEKLVNILSEKVHQTILEVDVTKLLFNIKAHQQLLQPNTKIMAIVKAFGYGSGSVEVAQTLQKAGIQYLAVAYTDEGVTLRKAGIHLPIMVMNVEPEAYDTLVNYNLEPELFSISILESFLQFAKRNALVNYPVHIKLDTGMHRLGFESFELTNLISLLKHQNIIQVQSIFSHLVGSEAAVLDAFTKLQNQIFEKMVAQIENEIGYSTIHHISNTAAIQRHPKLQHQMVRLGIGMYGISSNKKLHLQQVATLKATIAQIKTINKNETVGYNRNGKLNKTTTIATIRIGYADGYVRNLGNGAAKVLVNNKLVPTIGNICMDMLMIDITNVSNVQEGDYVTLFGDSPTISDIAKWSGTIPYEVLTNINERVKRVYIE